MKKRAAVELSVSTIVIVVLAMSMLILGIVLVKNIFSGANDIASMTNDQLKNQVSQLFGEDKRLVLYPDTRIIEAKPGELSRFGIGIKNLVQGSGSQDSIFSYEVVVSDVDLMTKCGVTEADAIQWISTGRAEKDILIAPADSMRGVVSIEVPEGAALCTFRLRVNVKRNDQSYSSDLMDVIIKP